MTTTETRTGVSDSEILIGSSAAIGGHASFLGTQTLHGSMAYINYVNENGGVHGRQIKVISYDDGYEPFKTVANTQTLINTDKVFALFDYVGTPTSVKIIDIVHNSKVPLIGLFTGAENLRVPFRPYIFNVRDSYYAEAEGAVAYFVDDLGLEDIAVFYQDDAFGLAVLSGAQLALERRGMETIATATYARGTMDVEEAIDVIKASEAEAVIMVGTYDPLAKFIVLSHQAEYNTLFHAVSFVRSEDFGNQLNEDIEKHHTDEGFNIEEHNKNIIVTQVVPSPFSEEYETVREYNELVAKYYPNDEPNYVALEGFVNAKVLVEALENAGPDLTREKFIEALESIDHWDVGIGKEVTYGQLDHQGLSGIYYSRLSEDGTFKIFNP